jgi:hypothetical protein
LKPDGYGARVRNPVAGFHVLQGVEEVKWSLYSKIWNLSPYSSRSLFERYNLPRSSVSVLVFTV